MLAGGGSSARGQNSSGVSARSYGALRAGEAAGVTLTSLVTLAGVGVAVSGTTLEVLRHNGISTGSGITAIFLAIAAALLPAAVTVLVFRRREGTLDRR